MLTQRISTSNKCLCGCGETTTWYRGKPRKYIYNHHFRVIKRPKRPWQKLDRSSRWKGGKMMKMGYIMLKRPNHPRADSKGYVMEHILVLEEKIGRPLERHEICHHINKIKTDNRPENLEVTTTKQHMPLYHRKERLHGERPSCSHCSGDYIRKSTIDKRRGRYVRWWKCMDCNKLFH